MKSQAILAVLAQVFPEQPFKTARFVGEGQDSRAYLVDEQYIFRFPKRAEVADNLHKEMALLPHLQTLPLRVPNFRFVGRHPQNGWIFVGYPVLPGLIWDSGRFTTQPLTDQSKTLQTLADFLTNLHAFDLNTARQAGVALNDSFRDYQETFGAFENELYPLIPMSLRDRITRRFESFLANPRYFRYTPCLIHDDFSSDHILCDPVSGLPQAVIDFGDVAIGDPDLDLKYLYDEAGPAFIQRLLEYYHTPTEPAVLMDKLAFFTYCEALQDALHVYAGNRQQLSAALDSMG